MSLAVMIRIRTLLRAPLFAASLVCASVQAAGGAGPSPVNAGPSADRRPGYGIVESVTVLRRGPAERSASSGASAPGRAHTLYRVRVRLDDGSIQLRDLKKREFTVGDRVLLTNAGDVVPD